MRSKLDLYGADRSVTDFEPPEKLATNRRRVIPGLLTRKCEIRSLSEGERMAIRRSSIVLLIVGLLLIAAAAAIKYVAVLQLSKLPEDTNEAATFAGTLRQLDPTTFALDAGIPIAIDRSVKVDQVAGDTAVVTSTAVTHLPNGDSADAHSYAISRTDYTPSQRPGRRAGRGPTWRRPAGPSHALAVNRSAQIRIDSSVAPCARNHACTPPGW
ncbi:porin PorA family protein [Rhodococcus wratislaviensis]|uniref:porin PorA family protein n=1 Tax=Rhodococcus wratislaviensis TaxID=44752 RepID=UPI0036636458